MNGNMLDGAIVDPSEPRWLRSNCYEEHWMRRVVWAEAWLAYVYAIAVVSFLSSSRAENTLQSFTSVQILAPQLFVPYLYILVGLNGHIDELQRLYRLYNRYSSTIFMWLLEFWVELGVLAAILELGHQQPWLTSLGFLLFHCVYLTWICVPTLLRREA